MNTEWTTFKTGVTTRLLLYSVVPVLSATALIVFALDAFRKFHQSDPTRWLFAGIPLLVGLSILICLLAFLRHYSGRTVRVKGRLLEYKHKDESQEFAVDIAKMAYSGPGETRFKTILISDGSKFVELPELFLGKEQFHILAEHIRKTRHRQRQSRTSSYSL
ncbi:MAG TPA: hypothetical protein EYO33_27390 [Phycisphaerales bacterium]|nr:hypothetical protein [Phycisphaerales bacterium]